MKNGKVSESILKRSVLKQLHTRNDSLVKRPMIGGDYAAIDLDGPEYIAFSSAPVTLEIKDTKALAKVAVAAALNNVAAAGGAPVGIMVTVLIPTTDNEATLRELMRAIDATCEEAGVVVMGGHTQVTRAVKNVVLDITAVGRKPKAAALGNLGIMPGMDIIITKQVGLEGTALLALEKEAELKERFSSAFIDKAKRHIDYLSIISEAAVAVKSDASAMHDVSEGGVFAALWEMAQASGVGLEIDLKKIPICQETVEICEFYDLNPYKLLSSGSLLIAARDGNQVVREIEAAGGSATIIGVATDSNDRVLVQKTDEGIERRFIETAQTDEIYKVLG